VKRVGGAQWSLRQVQEEVLGAPVDVAVHFHALVHALVETPDDGVLKPSHRVSRERPLTEAAGERRDKLGHRQIGHEDVVTALHDRVELIAAGLR